MCDHDEEAPKTPHPVWIVKKRTNPAEAGEASPVREDGERNHHRHVV
jgi:hypothetical protein